MRNFISEKMSTIGLSGIRKVNEKALAMERAGKKVIHFEIGRPDFDTPEYIKKAAVASLDRGEVFYTSNLGDMGLREAIAEKLNKQNHIPYKAENIMVSVGLSEAIFDALVSALSDMWYFNFEDVVNPELYYFEPVYWAFDHNPQITKGTSEYLFSPDAGCTRAQAVTFLWRAAGEPEPETKTNPFEDVKENDYFYKAVLWAVDKGITTGTTATTFRPNQTCTRAQIVTFLWRNENKPAPESKVIPFEDVKESDYFADAVLWAVEKNITTGTSATTFRPANTCTRAQIVTFLYRALAGQG